MSTPSLPRRYVVAGVATLGLVGGGAVVANAATTGSASPRPAASGAATGTASSTPRPATPPTPRPHLDGTVTAVSGGTITVKDHDGFTRTIVIGSSTKYTLDGKTSSRSAVTKGRFVHGDGTVDSNGTSLDATTVAIMTSAPAPGRGPGGHGPGGRGPGGRGPGGRGPGAPAGAPTPGKAPASGTTPSGAPSAPSSSAAPS